MKKLGLALGLGMLMVSGCAHQYVMKLSNGSQIVTPHKPKLQRSMYYYKGARGEVYTIPQSRVLEIEPASMVQDENKFTPAKPKKSHWWKFW